MVVRVNNSYKYSEERRSWYFKSKFNGSFPLVEAIQL